MIVDAILAVFTAAINAFAALLPDWEWLNPFDSVSWYIPTLGGLTGDDGGNPLSMFAAWASKYNALIPIQEAYALILMYVGFQVVLFAFQTFRFVVNIVRGSGA